MVITKAIKNLISYTRISYFSEGIYLVNYIVDILECIVFTTASYYLWIAIYGDKQLIKGITIKEMITYIILARIIDKIYEADIGEYICDKLITGDISLYLTKPINPFVAMFMETIGRALFKLIQICIPLYIIIFLFFSLQVPSLSELVMFSIQLLIGYILFLIIGIFVGAIGLYTQNIRGLNFLKVIIISFFSGSFIPIDLFPYTLRKIAEFLPFQGMYYIPINTFLGRKDAMFNFNILIKEFSWALVILVLILLLWKKGKLVLLVRGG